MVILADSDRLVVAARRVKILRIAETSSAAESARLAVAVRTAKAVRTAETARMAETVRSLPRRREEIRGRLKKRGPEARVHPAVPPRLRPVVPREFMWFRMEKHCMGSVYRNIMM